MFSSEFDHNFELIRLKYLLCTDWRGRSVIVLGSDLPSQTSFICLFAVGYAAAADIGPQTCIMVVVR